VFEGMGSLSLFPPVDEAPPASLEQAWAAVGRAFQATGDSMRKAINDLDAEIQRSKVLHGSQPE